MEGHFLMAIGDDQLNQESVNTGGRREAGFQTMKARMKVDDGEVKKLAEGLKRVVSIVKSLTESFKEANKQAGVLTKTISGISGGGGGSGGVGRTDAGGVATNPDYISQGPSYAQRAGNWLKDGGGPDGGGRSRGAAMTDFAIQGIQAAHGAIQSRIEGAYPYMLTADRTGLLYRQMYGGTQLGYQSQYRQPLASRLLGPNGIEPLLGLQAATGINANQMAGSVEAMRVSQGFGISTSQAGGMINALAQPGSSNMMTLLTGMGLYGPGGRVNDPMAVMQNMIQRFGLTNEAMVAGAFQPGSMTRANLRRAGLPEDMQNMLLQYAQQNVNFREAGGRGFYDPSKQSDRQMLGVDDSFAMEEQRTRMTETVRQEKFYRRQVDNFAQLEKNTQGLIEKFQLLEDTLSGIVGAEISLKNKWWMRAGGSILKSVGGAFGIGDTEHLAQPGMDSGFSSSLRRMKNAADAEGVPLSLTSGVRSSVKQENLFRSRYTPNPDGDVSWNGQTWSINPGASPAAPPGRSLHETGHAADLGPKSSYGWIQANAARFGLRHGGSFGEPWHVAPAHVKNTGDVRGNAATAIRHVNSNSVSAPSSTPASVSTFGMTIPAAIDSMSFGGYTDIGDGESMGGGSVITISPTINLQGSGNTNTDAERLAQRVISIIETSSAIRALRRS